MHLLFYIAYMISIDAQSGFCFGVVTAIRKAEEELQAGCRLYCLGEIVHNGEEVERLTRMGLQTITHTEYSELPSGSKVLIRAHGEPPETYRLAAEHNLNLVDASCPVVRHLQRKICKTYEEHPEAQIVIFGKQGHAEVVGLQGQTENKAIVVENADDLNQLDFSRDIYLFSQTTKSEDDFKGLISAIQERLQEGVSFEWHDTICSQVRNRAQHIRSFAASQDKVVFVGGRNSSNGKVLYHHCLEANRDTIFIESPDELTEEYIASCEGKKVGICGATSTPRWLMEACAEKIEKSTIKQ